MLDGGDESDQLLELQRRGLELATQEAEERRTEINAILSSRRVLLTAGQDPGVRDARLAILEELAHASYPSATVLAAARYLATVPPRRRIPRPRRLRQRSPVRGLRRVLGRTAALTLCVVAVAALLAAWTFKSMAGGDTLNTLTVLLTSLPLVAFVAGVVGARSARHGAGRTTRRHTPGLWYPLAGAAWVTALALLVSGVGESALGAHFTSGVLLVWSAFVAVSSFTAARWVKGHRRRARTRSAIGRAGATHREPLPVP